MKAGEKPVRVIRNRRNISISRVIALVFLGLILSGALVLTLPAASRSGRSHGFLTGLFTATSATCVTGLVRGDTWSLWSPFGQGVILCLIEIGGLGFMSAASIAFLMFRRKVSIQSQMVMAEAIGADSMADILPQQWKLLVRSFLLEAAGALILTVRFLFDFPFPEALKLGVFHAVSAFCNAGFDILGFMAPGASMMPYQGDLTVMLTLSALIILGGLGFLVWDEVLRIREGHRFSVYTRLVLIMTGALVLFGTLSFCLLEWNNPGTLGPMPWPEKLLAAFFQSVTLRTAGFAGIDQGRLTAAGKAVSIFLMLIGGSSGSTAGGMKTVTLVVLVMFLWNRMRGRYTVSVFHRTIADSHVLNAIMVFVLMVGLSFFCAAAICALDPVGFEDALFETVSAIGTVGLTAGITPQLGISAQLMIILLMYFGRVGVLTISFGFLKNRPAGQKFKYANTELLIG
ncbi:MAG: potassium uptake protein, TrkH family [Clostridia bacterium]|nr:potassium uptake protein, TrkH family [Clostridia bacterium]